MHDFVYSGSRNALWFSTKFEKKMAALDDDMPLSPLTRFERTVPIRQSRLNTGKPLFFHHKIEEFSVTPFRKLSKPFSAHEYYEQWAVISRWLFQCLYQFLISVKNLHEPVPKLCLLRCNFLSFHSRNYFLNNREPKHCHILHSLNFGFWKHEEQTVLPVFFFFMNIIVKFIAHFILYNFFQLMCVFSIEFVPFYFHRCMKNFACSNFFISFVITVHHFLSGFSHLRNEHQSGITLFVTT